MVIPLPFTCGHEQFTAGVTDPHGNITPAWSDPVSRACVWWSPSSLVVTDVPVGGQSVTVDMVVVVDSTVEVDHRDRFTIDGHRFAVVGLPTDYDHGPFGYSPNRRVVELKRFT